MRKGGREGGTGASWKRVSRITSNCLKLPYNEDSATHARGKIFQPREKFKKLRFHFGSVAWVCPYSRWRALDDALFHSLTSETFSRCVSADVCNLRNWISRFVKTRALLVTSDSPTRRWTRILVPSRITSTQLGTTEFIRRTLSLFLNFFPTTRKWKEFLFFFREKLANVSILF